MPIKTNYSALSASETELGKLRDIQKFAAHKKKDTKKKKLVNSLQMHQARTRTHVLPNAPLMLHALGQLIYPSYLSKLQQPIYIGVVGAFKINEVPIQPLCN